MQGFERLWSIYIVPRAWSGSSLETGPSTQPLFTSQGRPTVSAGNPALSHQLRSQAGASISQNMFPYLFFCSLTPALLSQALAAPPKQPWHDDHVAPSLQARATATPTPSPVNCPRWPILTDPYVNFDPLACVRHPEVTGEKGGKAQVYQEVGANGLDQGFVDTTTAALARALSFYAGNLGQTSVSSSR